MGQGIIDNVRYIYNISNRINSEVQIIVKFNSLVPKLGTNECIISIDSQSVSAETVNKIVMKVYQELLNRGVNQFKNRINIVLSNEKEIKIANELKKKLNIKLDIYKIKFNKFLKERTVTKVDNGVTRNYIERKKDDNNAGYLLEKITSEDMYNKLQEIVSNPILKEQYKNYSEEELSTAILDLIASTENKKKYLIETPQKQTEPDKSEELISDISSENNTNSNQEIGVIDNTSETSEITTTDEDDKLDTVEPEKTDTIKTGTDSEKVKEELVEEEPNYEYKFEPNNQQYNTLNNTIFNEEKLFEEMLDYGNSRKRVLTKPNNNHSLSKSNGIISLPIIIFIMSGLLLIGSLVLYLIAK